MRHFVHTTAVKSSGSVVMASVTGFDRGFRRSRSPSWKGINNV